MGIVCMYHRIDFDGIASAAIVRKVFPEVRLLPYNYGDVIDFEAFTGHDVIMVDCSMQPEEMRHVQEVAQGLTWIDHHKSAIEKMEAAGLSDIAGLRKMEEAGCELTWDYFCTGEPRPYAVSLLGRYDVFDLEIDPNVIPFQYGMRSLKGGNDPTDSLWEGLLSGSPSADAAIQPICKRGAVVFEYQGIQDEQAAKSMSFPVRFPDGTRGIACNGGKGSLFFKAVFDKEQHDVMAPFHMGKDGLWHVSLYSPQEEGATDCAKLAQQCDPRGGGHMNAAGFSCEELPWERVEE